MKILITGANGAIGSDLVRLLSKKNKIFAFYRTPNIISSNLKNKNIKWIKQDLKKKIIYNITFCLDTDCIIFKYIRSNFGKHLKCNFKLIFSNNLCFIIW